MKKYAATGITLNIDEEYVENIQLTVGSANETVQVAASAVQVDTTDMQLSNVVNSEQMEELPLIGRNFTGLELTLPGVQASSDRFGTYSVSGAQTQQSEFLINGADSNDIALNTLAIAPNLDAIDQFNLIEGPLNAEYDRNSGGIVSATIKEGTNHIHGDAFEFYRDTFLNTANFFNHTFRLRCPERRGREPLSPEHLWRRRGLPDPERQAVRVLRLPGRNQAVPETSGSSAGLYSASLLSGNFSVDMPNSYNPSGLFSNNPIPSTISIPGCTTAGETWSQCATALNGQFPTSSFNKVATNLISTYVPNSLINSGTYGYSFSATNTISETSTLGVLTTR